MSQVWLNSLDFCILSHHVLKAIESDDPLEEIKWIAAGIFGSALHCCQLTEGKGPINCFLGETY